MKILLFSDGTGNTSAKVCRTNVWRLYDALDLTQGDQVALYDNGVGTSSFAPLALLGGAFGWGLKRNVLDLYMFLCRNYAAGNRDQHQIYAFGFSRGAFTIRVLLGLLQRQGIVRYHNDERELKRQAHLAFREYRRNVGSRRHFQFMRWVRDIAANTWDRLLRRTRYQTDNFMKFNVEFVGLWDSVAAYGLPVAEMTRGWDRWIWPLTLPTNNGRKASQIIKKACHALALDDERQTFHPLLWNEEAEPNLTSTTIASERVSQVWFAGMHSNVGGGYPDDGMAYDSLCWIAEQATSLARNPILLKAGVLQEWQRRRTSSSPMADSRKGAAGYYRYMPRLVEALTADQETAIRIDRVKIHESVFKRQQSGVDGYAPIVLPARYAVVDIAGNIRDLPPGATPPVSPFVENETSAEQRHQRQAEAWDLVWQRRVVYFLTLVLTFVVIELPSWLRDVKDPFFSTQFQQLSALIGTVGSMLPSAVSPLVTHYQKYPIQFLVFGGLVVASLVLGSYIKGDIDDRMRDIWRRPAGTPPATFRTRSTGPVRRLRTSPLYVGTMRWLRHTGGPNVFGLAMLFTLIAGGTVAVARAILQLPVVAGARCVEVSSPMDVSTRWTPSQQFSTKSVCQPTGWALADGATYEIEMRPSFPWKDGSVKTVSDFNGFRSFDQLAAADWPFYVGWPLRRHLDENWFVPMARVRAFGGQQFALDKTLDEIGDDGHVAPVSLTRITPRAGGQLFLYVNDVMWFGAQHQFYENNDGTAQVRIRRVR